VVKTRVAERPWTSWGKLTGLEYTAPGEYTQEETNMLYRDCPAGEAVLRWQESLTRCGITTDADGDFGPQTEIQTKAFQIAVGLPESGKVDDVTYARMLAELLSIKPVEVPTGIPQSALDSLATQRDDLAKDLQSAVERADALQAQCDTETRISAERAQIAANYLADCKQFAQAETVKQGLVTKYINR